MAEENKAQANFVEQKTPEPIIPEAPETTLPSTPEAQQEIQRTDKCIRWSLG